MVYQTCSSLLYDLLVGSPADLSACGHQEIYLRTLDEVGDQHQPQTLLDYLWPIHEVGTWSRRSSPCREESDSPEEDQGIVEGEEGDQDIPSVVAQNDASCSCYNGLAVQSSSCYIWEIIKHKVR